MRHTRRHALKGYLALRQGFPPDAYEPLRIMARGGRPLGSGDTIAKLTRGNVFDNLYWPHFDNFLGPI